MKKVAVITDTHANLSALKVALNAINKEVCDFIYHVGDAIAIGPYPTECVDLLHSTPNLKCVVGNHDLYYLNGLPNPQPDWMSEGEVQHQHWTHLQLGDQRRSIIAQWQFILEEEFEGVKTVFVHYGLTSSKADFIGVVRNPTSTDLDEMFGEYQADILFFGHDHSPSDVNGKARYINPGSLGCNIKAIARYTTVRFDMDQMDVQHHSVAYDDTELYKTFEDRKVPERQLIYKMFFGNRFGV